ncbi:hypothetical protein L1987_78525 [Smallanthus sonchifolius]|uniref:Uncharacterized protein n=1 Tax=Smallanthus sonchifolius TaxID=185202 RepID=A0ACB8ZD60_9ASTR|nr:hypothetical protein L1987_78525 [Smallanthus sonchifolius]
MRCSPGVVSLIKEKLTSIQMLILEHTCFNMWIKERCTLADSVMVHLMFQHEIKSDLNPRSDGLFYVLAGEPLRFGPREFCLIIGLCFGKWDGEVPSLDSNFKDRVFVFGEKQTRTNADSQMLDMILNMMLQYFSGKRKWSSEEEEPTQPPNDHDEVEGMDDFDVKDAETPLPIVEVVETPKRTKRPSSTVLSPYIVYKKKQHKKNNVFM